LVNNYAAKVFVLVVLTKEIEVALYEMYFLLYEMKITSFQTMLSG
jgi:hypothetical protein